MSQKKLFEEIIFDPPQTIKYGKTSSSGNKDKNDSPNAVNSNLLVERFKSELNHHLEGWREKIESDFSKESYVGELSDLKSDKLYTIFGFATPQYVLIRLMGRMSISIGRRLGEIYDKIPRVAAQARYNLSKEQVAAKFSGLELDIGLQYKHISPEDREYVNSVLSEHFQKQNFDRFSGIGIEIRYNFNPNDSSRLRKDDEMAQLLIENNLFPIYLIFSTISPRDEAIARLTRSGWNFLIGKDASDFSKDILGLDIETIMEDSAIKDMIETEVKSMMSAIFTSFAFKEAVK